MNHLNEKTFYRGGKGRRCQRAKNPNERKFDRQVEQSPRPSASIQNSNENVVPGRVDQIAKDDRNDFANVAKQKSAENKMMNVRQDMTDEDRVNMKLSLMIGLGNTYDLSKKTPLEKFGSQCRLYVGDFEDVNQDEVAKLFAKYGETASCTVNSKKMFAFITLDYRANAEKAQRELDGAMRKNRPLKVRFAPTDAALRVKNLSEWVTNELLDYAFSVFGDVKNARVLTDERGNSLRVGIVEFKERFMAELALKQCSEKCFLLTNSPLPVLVEWYDIIDDADGYSDKSIAHKTETYLKSRKAIPRLFGPDTSEYKLGKDLERLNEMYNRRKELLDREFQQYEEELIAKMKFEEFQGEALSETFHQKVEKLDDNFEEEMVNCPAEQQHQEKDINIDQGDDFPRRQRAHRAPKKHADVVLYKPPQLRTSEEKDQMHCASLEDIVFFMVARQMLLDAVCRGADTSVLSETEMESFFKFRFVRNAFAHTTNVS